MSLSRWQQVDLLIDRIASGEVVFFVGSGFSVDSEGNTAARLMIRLLIRFQAFVEVLQDEPLPPAQPDAAISISKVSGLFEKLKRTFGLSECASRTASTPSGFRWLVWHDQEDVRNKQIKLRDSLNDHLDVKTHESLTPQERDGQRAALSTQVGDTSLWDSTRDDDVALLAREYYAANDWFCTSFDSLLVSLHLKAQRDSGVDLAAMKADQTPKQKCELEERLADAVDCLLKDIEIREDKLRCDPGRPLPKPLDHAPLLPIHRDLPRWAWENRQLRQRDTSAETHRNAGKTLRAEAGKALFLDTMGFADPAVMGGNPLTADPRQLESSYHQKLFPRHQVLARLAREGLCPIVLTTNYDLLLEGAWRQAGFVPETVSVDRQLQRLTEQLPPTPLLRMARIGAPHEFVRSGKAIRTSPVVKVHGCAELYRELRKQQKSGEKAGEVYRRDHHGGWRRYLRSMVFTYREIQNWREDSWARDYLATIQRTRTVAFLGYSLQDPVLHDSFRSIYEDMSRHPVPSPTLAPNPRRTAVDRNPLPTPAFFFAIDDNKDSFHGFEVLHAASAAVGSAAGAVQEHDHYLRFHRRNGDHPAVGDFPNLDDLFLWMYHRVIRQRQQESLAYELRSIARILLPHQGNQPGTLPQEYQQIQEAFLKLLNSERSAMEEWQTKRNQEKKANAGRPKQECICAIPRQWRDWLHRTTGWTFHFHALLLREISCVDQLLRKSSPQSLAEVRRHRWYFPVSANPCWTAWAVVVELALRNLLKQAVEPSENGFDRNDSNQFHRMAYPVESSCPTLFFRRQPTSGNIDLQPFESLRLNLGQFERSGSILPESVAVGRQVRWILRPNRAPWPAAINGENTSEEDSPATREFARPLGRREIAAPDASKVWQWALGKIEPNDLAHFLGQVS